MPIPAAFRLLDGAKKIAIDSATKQRVALLDSEKAEAAENCRIAESAVKLMGAEIGRQAMIGFAWAADVHGPEMEDLLTRVLTGRLKGILQQVRQEVSRLESLVKIQRQTAIELRIQNDRIEAARA